MMIRWPLFGVLLALSTALAAQSPAPPEPSPQAVAQLRHVIGSWDATTEFIGPDGAVGYIGEGQYRFAWVVPDRIVSGVSTIPALDQTSAILFFVRPGQSEIEMASVGGDGHLWRMTGPDDGETRTTPDTQMADGSTMMLRFTRSDVTPDSFASRMEISTDGGETWRLGNRQSFRRAASSDPES